MFSRYLQASILICGCVSIYYCTQDTRIVDTTPLDCGLSQHRVVDTMKQIRRKAGRSELFLDNALNSRAYSRAQSLSRTGELKHIDTSGAGPLERMQRSGLYRNFVGENLALLEPGPDIDKRLFGQWTHSLNEKRNVYSPQFTRIGIGFAVYKSSCVVVALFSD